MRRLSYPSHVVWIAALIVLVHTAAGQQPALEEVLRRMGQYLVDYEVRLSSVVAEEHYQQWTQTSGSAPLFGRGSNRLENWRTLTSDFLLIRLPGAGREWLGFRDVFLVDGKPVRGREERLLALLLKGSPDALEQTERIVAENARYNIGDVDRTINVPTLALEFLHVRHRARVSFRRAGEATIEKIRTWKIDYTEHTRPSVIRGPRGQDRLARGTAWVEPVEGTVLRTELDLGGEDTELLRSRITVTYRRDATLDLRVPSEMREDYQWPPNHQIGGLASYRNFRRFEASARIVPPQ